MSDQHHDRDTVVVRDGGSSTGLILGIIAVIIVLAGAWYFLVGPGANTSSSPTDINVDVTLPSAAPQSS
jgi:FlaG/FlaF family flagellin (archaellin)